MKVKKNNAMPLKSAFQIGSVAEYTEEADPLEDEEELHNAPPPPSPIKSVEIVDGTDNLKKSVAQNKLCMLGKTDDGDSYAYLRIECTDMGLRNISIIPTFRHLQYVNVSRNKLTLDDLQCLTTMPFLILIHADNNEIESAGLKKMKYLQVIIMNNNKISSLKDVYQPELTCLELGHNKIEEIDFQKKMKEMLCLDLRFNALKNIKGIDFPKLDSLYLAGNKITNLEGIDKLVNLRILHLRNNPLQKLAGFSKAMTRLSYINLRACKIKSTKQIKKLRPLSGLREIILLATPYMGGTGSEEDEIGEDDPEIRLEVLKTLPTLIRINKEVVTSEQRLEAKALAKEEVEEEAQEEEENAEEEEEENTDNTELIYEG